MLTGGDRAHLGGDLENGNFLQPTVFSGDNSMRIFQEEIFGPVLSVTSSRTSTMPSRSATTRLRPGRGRLVAQLNNCYRVGREIKAGRVRPTATTCIRPAQPSAATRSLASDAKPTR